MVLVILPTFFTFLESSQNNGLILENNHILPQTSVLDANYTVLSETEIMKIQNNNQSAEIIANNIITSINNGEFFKHNWKITLESTYQALKILEVIDRIDDLDIIMVQNYVLSCFNSDSGIFSDSQTGLYNYSLQREISGYSEVLATTYGVLILSIIGKLNDLTISEKVLIVSKIKNAIDPNNGGFCYRTDGNAPNKHESSSIMLSYFSYLALEAIEANSLTQVQINKLTSFVSNLQGVDPLIEINYGGFWDNSYYREDSNDSESTLEITYYAVKLLNLLGKLDEIDKNSLSVYINFLYDSATGGVDYMGFYPSSITPDYFSTACALYIQEIAEISTDIIILDAEQYILNGFNSIIGGWNWNLDSDETILFYTYMTIMPFYEMGNNLDTTACNQISSGLLSYSNIIKTNDNYGLGFSSLSNKFGSITEIYSNLYFLQSLDRLNDLSQENIDDIFDSIIQCYYTNSDIEASSFQEIPNWELGVFRGFYPKKMPFELTGIPNNASDDILYERGISQLNKIFKIIQMLNLKNEFLLEFDLTLFAQEIIDCQTERGNFFPYSYLVWSLNSYPEYFYKFHSLKLCFEAIESIFIIDSWLGTSFMDQIDKYDLKGYFERFMQEDVTTLYFSDKIASISEYEAMTTYLVIKTNEIANLGLINLINSEKIKNWVNTHVDNPKNNQIYDSECAIWLILIEQSVKNLLNLETLREIYLNYFGDNINYYTTKMLNFQQIQYLGMLCSDLFSSFYLSNDPEFYVGFSSDFKIKIAGILTTNFIGHEISIELSAELFGFSSLIDLTQVKASDYYLFQMNDLLPIEFYPQFSLEFSDVGNDYSINMGSLIINSELDVFIDLSKISNNLQVNQGEMIFYEIGIYLSSNQDAFDKTPIEDPIVNITVSNSSNGMIGALYSDAWIKIESSDIANSINWITLSINTSEILGNLSSNIEIFSTYFIENPSITATEPFTITLLDSNETKGYKIQLKSEIFPENVIIGGNSDNNGDDQNQNNNNLENIITPNSQMLLSGIVMTFGLVFGGYSGKRVITKRRDGKVIEKVKKKKKNNNYTNIKTNADSITNSSDYDKYFSPISNNNPMNYNIDPIPISSELNSQKHEILSDFNPDYGKKTNKKTNNVVITPEDFYFS